VATLGLNELLWHRESLVTSLQEFICQERRFDWKRVACIPFHRLTQWFSEGKGDLATQSNLLLVGSGDDCGAGGEFEERFTGQLAMG
jgi:hypothetical protein